MWSKQNNGDNETLWSREINQGRRERREPGKNDAVKRGKVSKWEAESIRERLLEIKTK